MSTELNWFKSSHSAGAGGECVEVASSGHAVLVRDSKDVTRPHLTVSPAHWARFVRFAADR
ncbi:DUF397 domain-containing protein [Streptomyces sp. NBC_01102]|uniref:DUF397 domain-containing protein n=1 Tax=unclassified Streptomyces TaxID=2593676 RepID=UPI00386B0708|nr:DUF397 domain-containing protein [Streptomyces sp. NBC_01102]